jgi:hypothetical protein
MRLMRSCIWITVSCMLISFYLPIFYPRELVPANVYPSPSPPTRQVHGFLTRTLHYSLTTPSPPLSDNVTSISQITAGGESFISLSPLSTTEDGPYSVRFTCQTAPSASLVDFNLPIPPSRSRCNESQLTFDDA